MDERYISVAVFDFTFAEAFVSYFASRLIVAGDFFVGLVKFRARP